MLLLQCAHIHLPFIIQLNADKDPFTCQWARIMLCAGGDEDRCRSFQVLLFPIEFDLVYQFRPKRKQDVELIEVMGVGYGEIGWIPIVIFREYVTGHVKTFSFKIPIAH